MKKIRKTTLKNIETCIGVVAFFIICSVLSKVGVLGSQLSGLLIPLGIYMILTISLNLTVGVLGELSLGHAGFMCIGAYVGGMFSILMQNVVATPTIRLILAMIVGGLFAGLFGFLIGIPILRLRGDYLAIVTLGFGEIIKSIAGNIYIARDASGMHFSFASPITGMDAATSEYLYKGAQGISAPRDTTLVIVVITLLVTMAVIMNFVDSKSGRACMAVRDNYIAASSVGINVTKYRLTAFVMSAFFAGIAGSLYAQSMASLATKKFDYNLSILILVFVVLGGLGSIRGSIIATLVLYTLPELFREFQNYRMLVYSILLILIMLFNSAPVFAPVRAKIKSFAEKISAALRNLFRRKKGARKNEQ